MKNPELQRLAGRVTIITGAGTGIGEAAAHAFAREGSAVVLVGRREAPLRIVAEAINALGVVGRNEKLTPPIASSKMLPIVLMLPMGW